MAERWRRRADEAMVTLARERGKALTGYAYLLTGDLGDAEDLVQEALIKTFLRRRSAELDSAESYVRRVILTTYIDTCRRRRRWEELRHLISREDADTGIEDGAVACIDVQAALAALPPQQRACVVLRYYDDLTVPEIADRLGIADGTVKRYLSVAVHRMEALLGPLDPAVSREIILLREGGLP